MTTHAEEGALARCRVLVVEDEYFIADDMAKALEKLGAEVVGPVPKREKALALISSGEKIDAAVLDINLRGEEVFPVADALAAHGIPFVFATGYDASSIPPSYAAVPRWEKPFSPDALSRALPAIVRNA
ncbi:chemotaxis protein CheY [Microvirga vignae]|uniref:Chemotaxis protein CheY n=1 Tax=Microvirga vignae TaxID=1225564 RepID=A0A0H1RG01_9HYPH|nr:response regulator [Microvirga vignae]KLK93984.1 chemotaxis protein CheY [Microvirga vignae]